MENYNQTSPFIPSAPPLPPESPPPPPPPSFGRSYASSWTAGNATADAGPAEFYYFFPTGTHPEIVRSFQAVDRDRSGYIDEFELQTALSNGHHQFSIRTVRWLMFLYKNPNHPSKMGPAEFAALWNCLGAWRVIFDRFDIDRSGKIDSMELREALRSLGYAVPPSVIQVLISNYTDSFGRGALDFDNFVECGMIVKGLTDKFKERDSGYTGSATFSHEAFMLMILPFIVP